MRHPFLPDRPVDEAKSLASVAAGGLPLRAQRRIAELHTSEHPIWTSTLSPGETVVARLTGLKAIGQVMGSSMYHVGFSGWTSWGGGELVALTAAHQHGRLLALSRMEEEARLLGAHLVIDIQFKRAGYNWADEMLEFVATGTAVRLEGSPPPPRPVLTLLEPDELLKLHQAGYWPVGVAVGNCFWYAHHADCVSERASGSTTLPIHDQASSASRDLAVERFRAFGAKLGAEGIVGVRVHRHGRDREYESNDRSHTSFFLDVSLLGTAVVRRGTAGSPPSPKLVVDLADRPSRYTHTAGR